MSDARIYRRIVRQCKECPNYDSRMRLRHYLGDGCKQKQCPIEDSRSIPDWCPLEKVEEADDAE